MAPLRKYVLGEFEEPVENGVVIVDLDPPNDDFTAWHEVAFRRMRDKMWAVDVCLFGHIAKRFVVFLDAEEGRGVHQQTDGHGTARQCGEQVEREASGGRMHHLRY